MKLSPIEVISCCQAKPGCDEMKRYRWSRLKCGKHDQVDPCSERPCNREITSTDELSTTGIAPDGLIIGTVSGLAKERLSW